MSLDNIQAVDEIARIKPDESLSANSIKFKLSSLLTAKEKADILKKARDEAYGRAQKLVEEAVATIKDGEPGFAVEAMNKEEEAEKYARIVEDLEKEIKILEGAPEQAIGEGSKAIRLMDKMYSEAKAKSNIIFDNFEVKKAPTPVEPVNIDVEEIAKENEEPVKENIDAAIEEKSLDDTELKGLFDESLKSTPVVESVVDRGEIERKINEKIADYVATEEGEKEEDKAAAEEYVPMSDSEVAESREKLEAEKYEKMYAEQNAKVSTPDEYVPMTDDEIAKAQEKIELEKYNRIYADRAANYQKYYEADLAKALGEEEKAEPKQEEAIRDDVIVAPEREEVKEYVPEDNKEDEVVPIVIEKTDDAEPVRATASEDFIKKLEGLSDEELDAELNSMATQKEKLEEEANSVEAAKEEGIRINSEVAAEEEEIEKKEAAIAEEEAAVEKENEKLQEEDAREKAEVRRKKIAKLIGIRENIDTLTSKVESDRAELADVNKNTEARRENISNKNRSIETRRENISNITKGNEELKESINKSREMSVMLSGDNTSEDVEQKIK